MGRVIARLVGQSVRRPWTTLFVTLLIVGAAILVVATRFDMTTATSALIDQDVAWRQQERAMESAFPQLRDNMLVVVDGATPELAEDGAARLGEKLSADKTHFRLVSRPDGGPFLTRSGLLFAPLPEVKATLADLVEAQPLLGPLAADPSLRGVGTALGTVLDGVERGDTTLDRVAGPMDQLATSINRSLDGKPAWFSWSGLLAGKDSQTPPLRRLILVQPLLDTTALKPGEAATDAIRAEAVRLNLDAAHGVNIALTGEVPLADEEFATLEENIGLVALSMVAAMLAVLWIATHSTRLVAAIMGTTVLGLVVTTAVGLLAVGRLNLISIAFIPLFVGLGVDFGIQICVRFNAERIYMPDPARAMRAAAAALGAPLALAAAAIFLGFGAFLPTSYVGIAELGVISGLGMVIALLFSVTLLPALVMLLRPGNPRGDTGLTWAAPADRWLETHRRKVLWAFGGAMLASIALLPAVRFDFNPLHLRDPDSPAMRALADLTRDPDRTPNVIDVLARSPTEAHTLSARLEKLPEVARVISLDSFVPEGQQAKLAAIQDAQLLLDLTLNPFDIAPPPTDAALVESARTLSGRLRQVAAKEKAAPALRLATALDRLAAATPGQRAAVNALLSKPLVTTLDQIRLLLQAEPLSTDTLPPELVRDWRTPDGRTRLQVFPSGDSNDNDVIQRFRAAVTGVTPAVSGLPVATQEAAATVAWAFVQAGIIAFALVSLLLFLALRNIREVLFTLAPVVLSIFLTLGTCVLVGQPINFANIIAFPLLFGVGVAFHIYFVMAWRAGARDLLQSSLARAVLLSALATGTAFGALCLSHHPGTASMGVILMMSLVWTLICALIFEPALLGPPLKDRKKA